MIKKLVMVLLCTALGSSLYAAEQSFGNKGFIGLEVGYGSVDADLFTGQKHSSEDVEYGFRLGAQSAEWRTMFVFDYYKSDDDDQTVEKGFLMVDYFFLDSDIDTVVRPYVGGNVGYANYESTLVDESGLLYGGQIGIVMRAGDSVDIDLSFRYSLGQVDAVNNVSSITLGINYLY
ncbi:hypothetical protein [Sulfurovum sp.]|uniref:hypothetical protein n=1 Tax=Sulfurovum sp. TaxID=1969726 RepID=UPI002867FC10|nr:hypothetical protein [Sulfurovum sp.]